MHFLFTFVGGTGHFNPLVPFAQAAVAKGHHVTWACRSRMMPVVEAAGFTALPLGEEQDEPPQRLPLQALDMERENQVLRDGFAGHAARRRAAALVDLCTEQQPDVLICDEVDFGAMIAAERLGLPHVSVVVIAAGSFIRPEIVAESLNRVRAEHGLPPDDELGMLSRYLVLSPSPRSYREPAFPAPATLHSFNTWSVSAAPAPDWLPLMPYDETLYFTLGTVFNLESGDLFMRVLAGLRDMPLNIVVTVGKHIDPQEFGAQPAHIHIEEYIPQERLLPHCDIVVSHGGSGSVMGALTHGVPMVLIPMGADQPLNAARCADLGVAVVLDPITATPDIVRESVIIVLTAESYRQAAEALSDEMAALPGPDQAVRLLEQLAREKRPILNHP